MLIKCARVLHETELVPVLTYSSETMLWKEKERSRITAVQIDNLRGLLGIRMDRVPNAQIRVLCGVMMGVDEKIDERFSGGLNGRWKRTGLLRGHVGECAGSRSMGRWQKRWIDTMKECLRKRGLDIRQARRVVQDRSEWQGCVHGA